VGAGHGDCRVAHGRYRPDLQLPSCAAENEVGGCGIPGESWIRAGTRRKAATPIACFDGQLLESLGGPQALPKPKKQPGGSRLIAAYARAGKPAGSISHTAIGK